MGGTIPSFCQRVFTMQCVRTRKKTRRGCQLCALCKYMQPDCQDTNYNSLQIAMLLRHTHFTLHQWHYMHFRKMKFTFEHLSSKRGKAKHIEMQTHPCTCLYKNVSASILWKPCCVGIIKKRDIYHAYIDQRTGSKSVPFKCLSSK